MFIEKPVFSFESNDVDALIEKKMDKNAAVSSFFYSYFGTVDKEIRCHLEKICYFTTRDKKEILFYEGQEGNNIYFLASGNVKLFRTDVEGKERSNPPFYRAWPVVCRSPVSIGRAVFL